eukprot:1283968-Heterocapsa_arctica.AAC.1
MSDEEIYQLLAEEEQYYRRHALMNLMNSYGEVRTRAPRRGGEWQFDGEVSVATYRDGHRVDRVADRERAADGEDEPETLSARHPTRMDLLSMQCQHDD